MGKKTRQQVLNYLAGKNRYPNVRSLLVRAPHDVREQFIIDAMGEYASQFSTLCELSGVSGDTEGAFAEWASKKGYQFNGELWTHKSEDYPHDNGRDYFTTAQLLADFRKEKAK